MTIDPTPLATRLWQTIWVATGKSPVKCLYNVVELFIFKFLSDLHVLDSHLAFQHIYEMSLATPEDALEYYARNTRTLIVRLFPHGTDGTTVINGTIFVTEQGEPNRTQAILFMRCLEHLHAYGEEFGSLTRIDKQFKTRLYESFLSQEVEALGQYFTPRKIVQSVIRMAGLDEPGFQFAGKRICDPFCGLGGFPLETLNLNEAMREAYRPDNDGKISVPHVMHGFDKGFERDDERTIILAKANMLIYLSELLFSSPQCSEEFAKVFNDTFRLFRDNLGTFGHVLATEEEKYDYILSNPPYVTSGSSIIKEELRRNPKTNNEYPVNALGLEGLSLEWIVKGLRRGGKAFVIIPDGILTRVGGKKLRDYILRECYLDAIVSLPRRAFFANEKQTYILAVTKKHNPADVQIDPVFTYLVSNIGERLTSVRRDEIDDNDLPLMEGCFKVFSGARQQTKAMLERESPRCKVQDISVFRESPHWMIDRWWDAEERRSIGLEEAIGQTSKAELDALLVEFSAAVGDFEALKSAPEAQFQAYRECPLGDDSLFRMFIGKRVLKKDVIPSGVPAYSANVNDPLGYVESSNVEDLSLRAILWGIDGNFDLRLTEQGEVYATTDHCGAVQILNPDIVPEYLLYAMTRQRAVESFTRSFRASLTNMRLFAVRIPTLPNGDFDVETQRRLADRFLTLTAKSADIGRIKTDLDFVFQNYIPVA